MPINGSIYCGGFEVIANQFEKKYQISQIEPVSLSVEKIATFNVPFLRLNDYRTGSI